MALEATHIRFALDVQDRYRIENLSQYIQGTIYPDSRYVSKIDRLLTHGDFVLDEEFLTSDFHKGWQVHQICDKLQHRVFDSIIPGFDELDHDRDRHQWWAALAAAKILADISDSQSFDIHGAMEDLDKNICPNGENAESMAKYHQIIADLYKEVPPDIDDYIDMWLKFGVGNELVDEVRKKLHELQTEKVLNIISSAYEKMIELSL